MWSSSRRSQCEGSEYELGAWLCSAQVILHTTVQISLFGCMTRSLRVSRRQPYPVDLKTPVEFVTQGWHELQVEGTTKYNWRLKIERKPLPAKHELLLHNAAKPWTYVARLAIISRIIIPPSNPTCYRRYRRLRVLAVQSLTRGASSLTHYSKGRTLSIV